MLSGKKLQTFFITFSISSTDDFWSSIASTYWTIISQTRQRSLPFLTKNHTWCSNCNQCCSSRISLMSYFTHNGSIKLETSLSRKLTAPAITIKLITIKRYYPKATTIIWQSYMLIYVSWHPNLTTGQFCFSKSYYSRHLSVGKKHQISP